MQKHRNKGKGKAKGGGHNMIPTYVYLTHEQWEWVHAEASKRARRSAAEIIREAIDDRRKAAA